MTFKYINTAGGGWDLTGYFEKIRSLQSVLPSSLYSFAVDPGNYSLRSHASLHDAWVNILTINETPKDVDSEDRLVDISIELLGPYHDKIIRLTYRRVSACEVSMVYDQRGHGDLLMHEVDVVGEGKFSHYLSFASGGHIKFVFAEFSHSIMSFEEK